MNSKMQTQRKLQQTKSEKLKERREEEGEELKL